MAWVRVLGEKTTWNGRPAVARNASTGEDGIMSDNNRVKTRSAAAQLGVTPPALLALIYRGKLGVLPDRDESGDYWWPAGAIEAARAAMAHDLRRRKEVVA